MIKNKVKLHGVMIKVYTDSRTWTKVYSGNER